MSLKNTDALIPKDLQDSLIENLWHDIKEKIQTAYTEGYRKAREDLLLEAKALIEASKSKI